MKDNIKKLSLFSLFGAWALFTLALLVWWVVFSFRQLDSLRQLNLASNLEILKHQKMLIFEGITLFVCLFIGAASLFYYIYKENKNLRQRRDFLSLFTHDLKTTISALRLMVERLVKKSEEQGLRTEAKEIQKMGTRLSQQLQNALHVSLESKRKLILEKLDVCEQINYLRPLWPDLSFKVDGGLWVEADALALRSICMNLIQNAVDHAQAHEVVVSQKTENKGFVCVTFSTPLARALPVEIDVFKENFRAFQSVDSSGVGLKLVSQIMKKMKGFVDFKKASDGSLLVSLYFKEGVE